MGCFCRLAVDAMLAEQADTAERPAAPKDTDRSDQEQLVQAASRWLAARWLPAPPWEPDPAWLDEELPPAPLPPEALSVICALIQAGGTAQSVLQLDLTQPEDTRSLARVVATLNERGDALETLAADARPWSELAALNDQADTVRKAASQGVFTPQETPQDEPIEPWRPFLARLKSLAPLVAIGQLMRIDLAEPEAFPAIADRLRQLRAVRLPDLAKPTAVLQIIDRASAIDRLTRSLGQNPVAYPIERVAAAVQARVAAAAAQLPPTLQASPGGTLLNAPRRAPNPSSLANPATVKAARRLDGTPLPWNVPRFDQLDLLTRGAPVLSLVGLLGPGMVKATPCGRACDAKLALQRATAPPGNGTDAVPAA